MKNILQMKLFLALMYIDWMTRGKKLKERISESRKRYIAFQEILYTGLVIGVKGYLSWLTHWW